MGRAVPMRWRVSMLCAMHVLARLCSRAAYLYSMHMALVHIAVARWQGVHSFRGEEEIEMHIRCTYDAPLRMHSPVLGTIP